MPNCLKKIQTDVWQLSDSCQILDLVIHQNNLKTIKVDRILDSRLKYSKSLTCMKKYSIDLILGLEHFPLIWMSSTLSQRRLSTQATLKHQIPNPTQPIEELKIGKCMFSRSRLDLSWQTSLGLDSMPRYSAQMLISVVKLHKMNFPHQIQWAKSLKTAFSKCPPATIWALENSLHTRDHCSFNLHGWPINQTILYPPWSRNCTPPRPHTPHPTTSSPPDDLTLGVLKLSFHWTVRCYLNHFDQELYVRRCQFL